MPSGLISMSVGVSGSSRTAMASAPKGVSERPWKERDQSTWVAVGEADGSGVGRGSRRPEVRLCGTGLDGVEEAGDGAGAVVVVGGLGVVVLAAAAVVVAFRTGVAVPGFAAGEVVFGAANH